MNKFQKSVPGGTNQNFNDPAIRPELLERANRIAQQAKKAKVEVRNADYTSDDTAPEPFKSWRKYWERSTGRNANMCFHCKTVFTNEDVRLEEMVGGHVVKTSDPFEKEHIIPLCRACNVPGNTDPFFVDENLLVPTPSELEKRPFLASHQ